MSFDLNRPQYNIILAVHYKEKLGKIGLTLDYAGNFPDCQEGK